MVKKLPYYSFENLEIWQQAIELAVKIYKLTKIFPRTEQFALTDQIKRSATSISANIAEASGRYHFKDRKNFLYNARGSLLETHSLLLLSSRLYSLNPNAVSKLIQDIKILSIKLNNFINSINKSVT